MARLFVWVVGSMVALVVAVWLWTGGLVDKALAPRYRYGTRDDAMERIEGWRSRLALVAYLGTYLVWAPDRLSDGSVLSQLTEGVFSTALVVVGALIVAWGVLVVSAREARLTVARHAALPIIAAVGTFGALGAAALVLSWLTRIGSQPASGGGGLIVALALLAVTLVSLIGVMSALWYSLRHATGSYFRAVDGHPTMRALVTLLLAAWLGFRGVQALVIEGLPATFPAPIAVALLLLTPSLLIVVAALELHRLAAARITIRTFLRPGNVQHS